MGAAYREALRLEEAGEHEGAYDAYSHLGGYADSAERLRAMIEADPALPYRSAKKGELIEFGAFEQDGDAANGPEPIHWIVLDRIDERLLLLSRDSLDAAPYHRVPFEPVTWEHSDLRRWMNSDFLATAFNEKELCLVPTVEIPNTPQSATGTAAGPTTRDRVFALSETEASIYISDAVERASLGSAALSAAVDDDLPTDEEGRADWWLRSPGTYDFTAQYVDREGVRHGSGAAADATYGVRPALWLDTSAGGAGR
ncbi:DUF6273 domain-containing protein [Schaalia turicensis]|uniref:DUF6273 domain-containing protein n=1 Tax=Schaalia turicensis TaxID=131111 RepID=UPI001E2B18FE|nr:DUF6273 domain-containing protein [Schaalia turicensis]